MNELDKAYETADMLKALDLPISKAQLDDIERLEKESGKAHREDLTALLLREMLYQLYKTHHEYEASKDTRRGDCCQACITACYHRWDKQ